MGCEGTGLLHESAEGLWHEEIMMRWTSELPILTQRDLCYETFRRSNLEMSTLYESNKIKECLLNCCVRLGIRRHRKELRKEEKGVILSEEMSIVEVRTQEMIN